MLFIIYNLRITLITYIFNLCLLTLLYFSIFFLFLTFSDLKFYIVIKYYLKKYFGI